MTASSPRVSILLPTHNRADVLPFAIRSALAQTMADFELLVVGDGCTDNTAAVVQGFNDIRLRWFDLPKAPGFGYANRNVALRQARGDVIAYLAHDDVWFPDHLTQLLACLEQPRVEFAYSLQLAVSTTGYLEPMAFDLNEADMWADWRSKHIGSISICNAMHRRECFDRYGYWNEKLRMRGDYELWMRFTRREPTPNFAYWPIPTSLRFVADWRRQRETALRHAWRRLRDWEHRSLPSLQLDLANTRTEQEAAWNAMQAAPHEWVGTVRRAVQADLSRREAFRFTLSDLIEAARRYVRRARRPKENWARYALPGAHLSETPDGSTLVQQA